MLDISWLIPKRVILVKGTGDVTLDDTIQMNDDIIALFDEGDAPVHIIFSSEETTKFPSNVHQVMKVTTYVKHPSFGRNMTIAPNPVLRFIGGLVYKVLGQRKIKFVESLDEAITLLREFDDTLPQISLTENL